MNTKTAVHFADNYLINPTNPLTVNLIGAGGTGSQMIMKLSVLNYTLVELGHAGLQVNLFDDDIVTEANQVRQPFADAEVGLYKSVALINRVNRFRGTNWKAVTQKFSTANLRHLPNKGKANIYISCVDTVAARFDIATALQSLRGNERDRNKSLYWMDIGNSRHSGQTLLSTIGDIKQPPSEKYDTVAFLPTITEEYKDLLEAEIDNNEPSCSVAEALSKQDLFINPSMADHSSTLLWHFISEGMTEDRGFFLNLKPFGLTPIKVA